VLGLIVVGDGPGVAPLEEPLGYAGRPRLNLLFRSMARVSSVSEERYGRVADVPDLVDLADFVDVVDLYLAFLLRAATTRSP
jgi:hypothetical protein